MSYRTGHQILANIMRTVADHNIPPSRVTPDLLENAIREYTGKDVKVSKDVLDRLFDAMHCVRERKYRGGAAPERVKEHIAAARANVTADRKHVTERAGRVEAAHHRLDSAFAALRERFGD